jgi:hypothetical protein
MANLKGVVYMGNFAFYEGNGGTQSKIGELSDSAGQSYNLKTSKVMDNDEARSVRLLNVRKDAVLKVYDNPDGKTDDDWTEILVLKEVQEYIVHSFEKTYADETVKVTYHPHNGLDGKISHIKID